MTSSRWLPDELMAAGVFLLLGRQRAEELVQQHFGKADDRVQRCPQLMADIGEEVALDLTCRLGLGAGVLRLLFRQLARGDVGMGPDHATAPPAGLRLTTLPRLSNPQPVSPALDRMRYSAL